MIIRSSKVWDPERKIFSPAEITIKSEKIAAIDRSPSKVPKKVQDFGDAMIGPSAIDLHVHARDFDESHKETFESCEQAAFAGGVAVVATMANTRPRLDSEKSLELYFKKTKSLLVQFIPFVAVTENLEGKTPTNWSQLLKYPVAGLSDDGRPIVDDQIMEKALLACKRAKKILSLHEEDLSHSRGSILHESCEAVRCGIDGSPSVAESVMVERDLKLAHKLNASVHFGHLSSKESVSLLRRARRQGVLFSAEVTPHHALLTTSDIESMKSSQWAVFKVCPPIRSEVDQKALHQGIKEGLIDCFATDHAPHSVLEKDRPLAEAMHGIVALENYYPLYLEVRDRLRLNWHSFFRAIAFRSSELLKLPTPMKVGSPADLVVFKVNDNPRNLEWKLSKANNTPFNTQYFDGVTTPQFRGQVIAHYVRGSYVKI